MRIAIDAMGGDLAPEQIVLGAISAADTFQDVDLVLVGDESQIKALLVEHAGERPNMRVKHASQAVGMDETARLACKKRDSSICRAVELVAQGQADAVVSAGNTAAAVAWSTLKLRTLPGVHRPGIGITLPTLSGCCILMDAGANIDCKPEHLYQYAVMASVLAEKLYGIDNPRVGLLSVGEEDDKGTDLVKKTHALLSMAHLNFVGNIEGNRIYTGDCDVIVCDGFAGNVILKTSEGLSECLLRMIKAESMKQWRCKLGAWLALPAFRRVITRIDFSEYGAEPLLGVNGISMISHGRSDAKAIRNAVRQTCRVAKGRVNQHVLERLESDKICREA